MSTNYYAHICYRDGRDEGVTDVLHVGKHVGHLRFGFRGYRGDDNTFGVVLDTAEKWDEFIRRAGNDTIKVEYFEAEHGVRPSTSELIALVTERVGRRIDFVPPPLHEKPDKIISDGRTVSFYEFC
jgi:hypothetical protein